LNGVKMIDWLIGRDLDDRVERYVVDVGVWME
jgi:hypothetical protein